MEIVLLDGKHLILPNDRLTRFETARLLGSRALQISLGAPILIKTEEVDPKRVARDEFRQKIIPITIKRKLPSGQEMTINVKKGIENWLELYGDV